MQLKFIIDIIESIIHDIKLKKIMYLHARNIIFFNFF